MDFTQLKQFLRSQNIDKPFYLQDKKHICGTIYDYKLFVEGHINSCENKQGRSLYSDRLFYLADAIKNKTIIFEEIVEMNPNKDFDKEHIEPFVEKTGTVKVEKTNNDVKNITKECSLDETIPLNKNQNKKITQQTLF